MCRLLWAFADRICPKTRFRMARPRWRLTEIKQDKNLLKPISETHGRTLRSSVNGTVSVKISHYSVFDRSFSYSATRLWNPLPNTVQNSSIFENFKKKSEASTVSPVCDNLNFEALLLTECSFTGLGDSVRCASDWWSEGCGFDPCRIGNILSWRLIMKYFLRSFSP